MAETELAKKVAVRRKIPPVMTPKKDKKEDNFDNFNLSMPK
jgi:hypothetical protein